jgi:hypothetical protein
MKKYGIRSYFLSGILCCAFSVLAIGAFGETADTEALVKSFMEYSRAVLGGDGSREGRRPMPFGAGGPQKMLAHPYAQKSLLQSLSSAAIPGKGVDPQKVRATYEEAIAVAEKAESLLANPVPGQEQLEQLLEIHPYSIMTVQEPAILWRLALVMMIAKRPSAEIMAVLGMLQAGEPMRHFMRDLPRMDPESIRLEYLVWQCRNPKPEDKPGLMTQLESIGSLHMFDAEVLYNLACGFLQLGETERARSALVRSLVLRPDQVEALMKDPDLAILAKDSDLVSQAKSGTLKPQIMPSPDLGVESIEVKYHWGGLGKSIDETRTLVWKADRFVDEISQAEVAGGLVSLLLKEAEKAQVAKGMMTRIVRTDDYPTLMIKIQTRKGTPMLLVSASNAPFMLPFNLVAPDGIKMINQRVFGQCVAFLVKILGIKQGSPRGSYNFGGVEIPVPENDRGRQWKSLFEKAGIPTDQIKIAQESGETNEEIPELEELTDLSVRGKQKTEIPSEDLAKVLRIQRIHLVEKDKPENKGRQYSLTRFERGGKISWFYATPKKCIELANEAAEVLGEACSGTFEHIQVLPAARDFGPEGFPGPRDILMAISILEQAGEGFDALGESVVPMKIRGNFQTFQDAVEGFYLPGAKKMIITDVNLRENSFQDKLAKTINDWCGVKEPPDFVGEILVRNNMVYLEFKKDKAEKGKIDELAEKVKAAGFTPEILGTQKILVKMPPGKQIEMIYKKGEPLKITLRDSPARF